MCCWSTQQRLCPCGWILCSPAFLDHIGREIQNDPSTVTKGSKADASRDVQGQERKAGTLSLCVQAGLGWGDIPGPLGAQELCSHPYKLHHHTCGSGSPSGHCAPPVLCSAEFSLPHHSTRLPRIIFKLTHLHWDPTAFFTHFEGGQGGEWVCWASWISSGLMGLS